jgi:hypothetical protein
MKFNDILTNHGFENGNAPLPMWKLQLTTEEYSALKQELLDAFKGFQLFRIAKEAALYYANWWSKEYVGGTRDSFPSKEKIAADLGIRHEQSDELYLWAKRGLSQLRISPIFRNGRTHYFRTLLLQGGLPVKSLKEGNNKANYGAFLEGLIKYSNEVNIDFEDISFIDYLPCKNRLAPSFRTSDFYELNLIIIEDFREKGEQSEYWELISAIFDREDDKGNIQKIKKLISEKKDKTTIRRGLFSIDWNLRKFDAEVLLFYTLFIPQKIKQTDVIQNLQSQYEFSVFLNNKEIAKYNRSLPDNNGNVFFLRSRGTDELTEKLNGISDVYIRLTSNGEFHELNYSVPDFSQPVLLTGVDSFWSLKRRQKENIKSAVLVINDSDWKCIDSNNIEQVKFYGNDAVWVESENEIELCNEITNDIQKFDNSPFLYRYEIYQQSDFKSKNRKLITSATKFRIIYNIDNEPLSRGFDIYFHTKQGTWVKYSNTNSLPVGFLYFKFVYPDSKTEFVNFFNIGNLSVNYSEQAADTGIIHINNWSGSTQPWYEQNGIIQIEQIQDNKWKLFRDTENRYYANDILFKITDNQGGFADMFIAPPFQGTIITDYFGNTVENYTIIALHSLWRYKCIILGSEHTTVTIFHNKNRLNKRTFTYNLGKRREIPLSDIEESIKNLFTLFGTDHTDYDSYITIKIGRNYSISVRPFNVNILKDRWVENKVVQLDNNKNISRLLAIRPDCEYPDEIDIIELQKNENGFVLSEIKEDVNGFIVFSDDNSSQDRVRPTFLPTSKNQTPFKERQEIIKQKVNDARFNGDIWDNTIVYFKILTSNNLPLRTLDIFRIIAESPLLCAKLALILLDHQEMITPEERKNGLEKFESEFAIAWHWIDYVTWKQAIDWLRRYNDIADYYIQDLLKNSLINNSDAIEELYRLFSTEQIEYNPNIDCQSFINKYTPYVDIQSEDWLIKTDNNWIVYPKLNRIWQGLFTKEYGSAIRTFLWGPAKAALSAMRKDTDEQGKELLWLSENETQRRIMFYYWKLNPEAYTELFLAMVKKINYRMNSKIQPNQ